MKRILTVTGHRPDKLGKELYDWNAGLSRTYINFFMKYISEYVEKDDTAVICRSGMALGVDTMFAIAVLRLKKLGLKVELECCIPCAGHSSKWNKSSQDLYNKILEASDKITHVSTKPYTISCMQDRNKYMVDNGCRQVLAIWDGTNGGTGNCTRYAKAKGIPIDLVNPEDIKNGEYNINIYK